MTAKSEFVTPWGVCDLVGLRFNAENVARRIQLQQTRPVTSITRARFPSDSGRGNWQIRYVEKLLRRWTGSVPEEAVRKVDRRLVADRLVVLSSKSRLQKVNGWMPLQDRMVAVELKLSRVEEAMRQALNNLAFADESYVALPGEIARRVASTPSRWSTYSLRGRRRLAGRHT